MLTAAILLLGLGILVALAGNIWFLVVAFQRSVGWGLAVLLLPLANLVFLFCAWAEAKRPFLLGLVGVGICTAGFFALPQEQSPGGLIAAAMQKSIAQDSSEAAQQSTANAVNPLAGYTPALLQARLVALKAREADLLERKAALNPKDTAGTRALAEEIACYNSELHPVLEQMKRTQTVAAAQ